MDAPGLVAHTSMLAVAVWIAASLVGCGPWAHDVRAVDVTALRPDQVLVLGYVRLRSSGDDDPDNMWSRRGELRSRVTWIDATNGESLPLPESGEVAWVMDRSLQNVRLGGFATDGWRFGLGRRPLLVPGGSRARIVYFGDVVIRLERSGFKHEANARRRMGVDVEDGTDRDLRAFVSENPALAGQPYENLVRPEEVTLPAAGPSHP